MFEDHRVGDIRDLEFVETDEPEVAGVRDGFADVWDGIERLVSVPTGDVSRRGRQLGLMHQLVNLQHKVVVMKSPFVESGALGTVS